MKKLGVLIGLSVYALYGQCGTCSVSGSAVLPRGFDPDTLILVVGRDTEAVIQFTLQDDASVSGITVYPNYAIYVDSLRMASGTQYVVVKGTSNTPVSYGNGAFRFDQDVRYKQVQTGVYARVVVYQNPSDGEYTTQYGSLPDGQSSPARGCVRACLRGINPTPPGTADSLRIQLRAFIDPSTISFFPSPSGSDASNKDTTNLMPTILGNNAYLDTVFYYSPVIVQSVISVLQSAVSGKVEVSPNPAWGVAKVRFALNYPVITSLRALDGSGRVVYERMLGELAVGEHTEDLRLPPGVYIVELTAGRESYKTRLVVLE